MENTKLERNLNNSCSPSRFYTTYKISTPFKIFLLVLVIFTTAVITHLSIRSGESWNDILALIIGVTGGSMLIYWFMTTGARRIRSLTNLSDAERSYVENLNRLKITLFIKKYVFLDKDMQNVLSFIVIMDDLIKWMLFYIFTGASIILILRKETLLNKALMFFLAIVWFPWIEKLMLKRTNYKMIFLLRIILTITIFSLGIKISS